MRRVRTEFSLAAEGLVSRNNNAPADEKGSGP